MTEAMKTRSGFSYCVVKVRTAQMVAMSAVKKAMRRPMGHDDVGRWITLCSVPGIP
jgi:hypothetical protein